MAVFRKLFGKYLLVTNTVSSGLIMAAGDILQQQSGHIRDLLENTNRVMAATQDRAAIEHRRAVPMTAEGRSARHDYARTTNMAAIGLLHGTFNHYFYTTLDRALPGKCPRSIALKTVLDQLLASPVCLTVFFAGLGLLERRRTEEIRDEVATKFRDAWKDAEFN